MARASGSSLRPPNLRISASLGSCARAVLQMFSPALIWRSNRQPHFAHSNTWSTLLRRLMSPHLGQVLLVYSRISLDDRNPTFLRLVLDLAVHFALRLARQSSARSPATSTAFWQTQILKGDCCSHIQGQIDRSLTDEMQPLGDPIVFPPPFFRC